MNKIHVISDTHFGHKNIINFEPVLRPFRTIEEHDRALVERWNAAVHPKDTVWHLGDVFFGKEGHQILKSLNGLKRLVLGNHDHYPIEIYQRYFSRIYGAAEYSNCILTHVPIHPAQLRSRYRFNIHGHLHAQELGDSRYICVSVEHTGLKPVLLNELIERASQLV